MITYPEIDPVIFTIGPVQPHWYGLMYILAFIGGWFILKKYNRRDHLHLNKNDFLDLCLYVLLGVIVGGRLGYVWFYNLNQYLANPIEIFQVWNGGMSFHGGLIGVIVAMVYFAWRKKVSFHKVADIIAINAALGVGLVRIGNFINGELFGRASDVAWCMVFPKDKDPSQICRHPSQLYQMLLEGFLLMGILIWLKNKKLTPGITAWSFAIGYGVMRFAVEFVRQPDPQIGLYFGWMSQGQLLSIPLILAGVVMVGVIWRRYGLRGE